MNRLATLQNREKMFVLFDHNIVVQDKLAHNLNSDLNKLNVQVNIC